MSDTIGYELKIVYNKKLKHSYLQVKEAKVIFKTPNNSKHYIEMVLAKRKKWIEKQLLKLQNRQPLHQTPLHSLQQIAKRVDLFANKMGVAYTQLRFRKMKRRWGSCDSQGRITLNRALERVDEDLMEYVVVHELSHLVHMNHSKEFYNHLQTYLPNYKELQQRLHNITLES